jgi:hemerythrin-like metal-binding protein
MPHGKTVSTLIWTDDFALHQPRMDETHREFVELLAGVEAAAGQPGEGLQTLFDAFVVHTRHHFAQEEAWMSAIGFAPENCHTFQHANVLQVLAQVQQQLRDRGDVALVRHLVGELALWFPAHAQMMDAALAQTIVERGFDTETGAMVRPMPAEAEAITGCGGASCS